jgi:hypothetical protein
MEPFIGGVTWDDDGVSINLKFVFKNSGKIPAMRVDWDTDIVPTISAEEPPATILKKKSAEKRQGPAMGILGAPLFPNETKEWFTVWPEVTKRPDFTHKRTNHELRRPCERYRARPSAGESVTVFPGRSLGAPDTAAPARGRSAAPSASSVPP